MNDAEDPLRAIRLAKLDGLKALGIEPYPYAFSRTDEAAELERRHAGLPAGAETERAGACRRPHPRHPQQRHVHRPARRLGQDPDLLPPRLPRSRRVGGGATARHRRSDRGRGNGAPHPARRADRQRRRGHGPGQDPAPAAREISRSRRCRAALPPALSRPDHEPGEPRDAAPAQQDRRGVAQSPRRARLSRSRDADAAHDPRRRLGEALCHPSQRARHRTLSADRARAAFKAAGGRRPGRQGVRDQPLLPQRRALAPAQPGIHHARTLRGLCRLHRDDAVDRGADQHRREDCARDPADRLWWERDRSVAALAAAQHGRVGARGDRRRFS